GVHGATMKFVLGRRELLQKIVGAAAIAPVTMAAWPTDKSRLWPIHPGPYILFVDPRHVDIQSLLENPNPDIPDDTMVYVVAVKLRQDGQTIDDVVKIYGLDNPQVRTP
ncbi:MAG TPA: hypothetical protein VF772_24330, partial [Terriglobales bacterium]